jgi:hypothetical protein
MVRRGVFMESIRSCGGGSGRRVLNFNAGMICCQPRMPAFE